MIRIPDILRKHLSQAYVLWWIWALSLFLRLGYALFMGESLWVGDAQAYLEDARLLWMGQAYAPYWPPGLPLMLAAFHNSFWAVTGLMLMAWSLFFSLLYHLLHKRFAADTCHLILFLFSIYPAFILHSTAPLTHLWIGLGILLLFWYWEHASPKIWHQLGIGFCLGTMVLIRPASLSLVAFFLLYLAWFRWRKNWRGAWSRVFLLLVPVLMIYGWNQYASAMSGRPIFINEANGRNFFIGNNAWTPSYKTWWLGSHEVRDDPTFTGYYHVRDSIEVLPPAEGATAWRSAAISHIQARPFSFIHRSINRIACFFAFDTYAGANLMQVKSSYKWLAYLLLVLDASCFVLLMVWGIIGFLHRQNSSSQDKNNLFFIPLLILAFAFPYFLAFSHPTYHLPIMGLVALMGTDKHIKWHTFQWILVSLILANQLVWVIMASR